MFEALRKPEGYDEPRRQLEVEQMRDLMKQEMLVEMGVTLRKEREGMLAAMRMVERVEGTSIKAKDARTAGTDVIKTELRRKGLQRVAPVEGAVIRL